VSTTIALFRGINVGGHHKLPMRELVSVLEDLGLWEIETYIQSGNVVFDCEDATLPGLSDRISQAVEKSHGFAPHVLILSASAFERAAAANPFPEAESEPKTLHLYFLVSAPLDPDWDAVEALKVQNESYALVGEVFYLHAPDGIGRSKLAARVENVLGVDATARNWRTVSNILVMAKS